MDLSKVKRINYVEEIYELLSEFEEDRIFGYFGRGPTKCEFSTVRLSENGLMKNCFEQGSLLINFERSNLGLTVRKKVTEKGEKVIEDIVKLYDPSNTSYQLSRDWRIEDPQIADLITLIGITIKGKDFLGCTLALCRLEARRLITFENPQLCQYIKHIPHRHSVHFTKEEKSLMGRIISFYEGVENGSE